MAKNAHDPREKTKPVSIMQVIGDKDKSLNGSTNPKVTMYSADERIEIWRKFNRCGRDPVVVEQGDEIVVSDDRVAGDAETGLPRLRRPILIQTKVKI